jgi:hypothetical protein
MTNKAPQTEYDSPWKQMLQLYFQDFMQFFFPQAHVLIDWSRGFVFLDQELQQVVRDAELGKRLIDKLVKIYRIGGEEEWLLIHVEVQSQEETDFPKRMFVYNYRIFDRYNRSVASCAVLGDENIKWRPNRFGYELFGFEREAVINLLAFIDWMLTLPLDLELEFKTEVEQLEAQVRMQYVTSFERIARMESLLEGIEVGLKLKFGTQGLSVLPEISTLEYVEQLRAVLKGLETASNLDELRSLYQPTTDTPPEN